MHSIIFATNNANKVAEAQLLIPDGIEVISLKQARIEREIEEPFHTLEENAREKMTVIHQLTGRDCFSEDTGLEVEALNGSPGVRSARYAGENATHHENIDLLLKNLEASTNRNARFRTVIALQWKGNEYLFEGICPGIILHGKQGEKGFGYDPVFVPDGSQKSFAEMAPEEKSKFSHRAKAVEKLIQFLKKFQ